MDTGDSRNGLSERNKFPASTSHSQDAALPAAFHNNTGL